MSSAPYITRRSNATKSLLSNLAYFQKADVAQLLRPELGVLGFADAKPIFEAIHNNVLRLQEVNLEAAPIGLIEQVSAKLADLSHSFERVRTFDPVRQNQTVQNKNQYVDDVEQKYAAFFEFAQQLLVITDPKLSSLAPFEDRAKNVTSKLNEILRDTEQFQEKIRQDAEKALAHAKQAAAGSGVTIHAGNFSSEAEHHRKASIKWFVGTIACALATAASAAFSVWLTVTTPGRLETAQAIQVTAAKLVLFSVLYFATIWCARAFKAHKHNEVINRHRNNALKTFEAFISATDNDKDTKNAVLLQTTQAIFGHVTTGFATGDTEHASAPQILEIVRSSTSRSNQS